MPYDPNKPVRYKVISRRPRPPGYRIDGGEIIEWVWTERPKPWWRRLNDFFAKRY